MVIEGRSIGIYRTGEDTGKDRKEGLQCAIKKFLEVIDKCSILITVKISQVYIQMLQCQIAHFKDVKFILCQLCLSKAVKKSTNVTHHHKRKINHHFKIVTERAFDKSNNHS